MQQLSRDMASIRSLFTTPAATTFSQDLRNAVLAVLTDPAYGFNPNAKLRFRSSTGVATAASRGSAGVYSCWVRGAR